MVQTLKLAKTPHCMFYNDEKTHPYCVLFKRYTPVVFLNYLSSTFILINYTYYENWYLDLYLASGLVRGGRTGGQEGL